MSELVHLTPDTNKKVAVDWLEAMDQDFIRHWKNPKEPVSAGEQLLVNRSPDLTSGQIS